MNKEKLEVIDRVMNRILIRQNKTLQKQLEETQAALADANKKLKNIYAENERVIEGLFLDYEKKISALQNERASLLRMTKAERKASKLNNMVAELQSLNNILIEKNRRLQQDNDYYLAKVAEYQMKNA